MFAECKWQENVNARKILAELKEKAKFVQWNNEKRNEHYTIFAKSFKQKIKEPDLTLFELKANTGGSRFKVTQDLKIGRLLRRNFMTLSSVFRILLWKF